MNKLTNVKPTNLRASDIKPSNLSLQTPNFTYLDMQTISEGQPLPWGLNWAITYPVTLNFLAARK